MTRLELMVPGHRQHLKFIDDTVLGFLRSSGVNDYKIIHFALHEAVINSIQQIEKKGSMGIKEMVSIEVTVTNGQLIAQITDWMGGIKNHKDNMVNELRQGVTQYAESGRGLLMIEQMVDKLSWECKENDEFVLRMEKSI